MLFQIINFGLVISEFTCIFSFLATSVNFSCICVARVRFLNCTSMMSLNKVSRPEELRGKF